MLCPNAKVTELTFDATTLSLVDQRGHRSKIGFSALSAIQRIATQAPESHAPPHA